MTGALTWAGTYPASAPGCCTNTPNRSAWIPAFTIHAPEDSATAAIGGYRGSPRKREAQGWTVSFECGLARIAVMKALNRNGPREAAVGARSPVIGAKSQDTTRRFV
jgi:hypothetical protein